MTEEQKKRKMAYDTALNRRTLDRIVVQPRKTDRIPALLDKAVAEGHAPSRTIYIIQAIREKLDRDGITLDD